MRLSRLLLIALLLGGCSYGKNAQNNMAITAEYEADQLKRLDVICGRDEDVNTTVDKAVVK